MSHLQIVLHKRLSTDALLILILKQLRADPRALSPWIPQGLKFFVEAHELPDESNVGVDESPSFSDEFNRLLLIHPCLPHEVTCDYHC
jgi:hypothetical protein